MKCFAPASQRATYQFTPSFTVEDSQFRRSLDNFGSVMVGGNSATLLENGAAGRLVADAKIEAGRRGVSVRLLVDAQGGKLGGLQHELEVAGVKCRFYRPANRYAVYGRRTHRRLVVVDRLFATIGSINVDVRSMSKNAEESVSFYDRPLADSVEAMFQRDLALSHEVTYEAWRHRGVTTRIFELLSWIWEPYY